MSYWDTANTDGAASKYPTTDPTVPPGYYTCEVVDFFVTYKENPRTGEDEWSCKWTVQILDGVQQGKFLVRWAAMVPEKAHNNAEIFMHTMGSLPPFDPDHGFADVEAVKQATLNAVVKVKVEAFERAKAGIVAHINGSVKTGGPKDASAPTQSEAVADFSEEEVIPF